MATSGSKSVTVTEWDTLKFSWAQQSQSVANNTTTITWKLELIATEYGYISSSASKAWSVTVNGTNYSGTNTVGISNNSTRRLASGTTTITHGSDGTKTFNYSFSQAFDINFNGWVGTISGSGSGTLNTIPRKSTLSVSNGTLGTSQTLTITRQASSFTHTITYKCGNASGSITGETPVTGTSISWAPPLSLSSQNTAGTSVSVTLTLTTYSGSTPVGSNSYTKTYTIPASVKPSCTLKLEDTTGWDDVYGSPVQGLSKIKITVTPTTSYSSPIMSYSVTADGEKYTSATATTGALKAAGSSTVSATVKDKRGRTGTASYTMSVQAYTAPSISRLVAYRSNSLGATNDQGDYITVIFSAAVTSLNSKNTASYVLRYKKTTATTYTTVDTSALSGVYTATNRTYFIKADTGSSYDIEVSVTDRHHTTTRSTNAPTAFTLMHWGVDGTSMGIGKVAETPGTLEVALDNHFYGSTQQEGNRYAFSSPGEAGTAGYVLMARIAVTDANADTPITFVLSRRKAWAPMTVHVCLANSTATASVLSTFLYEGANYGAFLVQESPLAWAMYVQKSSAYDTITIQDWWMSKTMESRVQVTFPGDLVAELPGEWYRATPLVARSILDSFFPVGYVLILYSHADPNDMYPGSTWARLENAFLWACDPSGTIGQTGGEKEHTLTVSELPSHSHGSVYSQHATGTKSYAWYTTSGTSVAYGSVATGGGAAHNNMPPYIQVSVWRRTN